MYQRIRKAMKEESGFTLIELLIVIVILGILAAIVVFSVSGITDKGTSSACKADVATAQTAVEAFYAQGKPAAYPASLDELMPGFLRSVPTDVKYDAATHLVSGGADGSGC